MVRPRLPLRRPVSFMPLPNYQLRQQGLGIATLRRDGVTRYHITMQPASRFSRQASGLPLFWLPKLCNLVRSGQGVDTTKPAGKTLFGITGVFAKFERAMIRERVCAGLDKARAMEGHGPQPCRNFRLPVCARAGSPDASST